MEMSAEKLYELSQGGRLSYDEVVARQRTKADWEARLVAEQRAKEQQRVAEKRAQDQRDRTRAGFEELFARWLRVRRPTCWAEAMGKGAVMKRLQAVGWSEDRLEAEAMSRGKMPLPDHMNYGSLAAVRRNFESELAQVGKQEMLATQEPGSSRQMDRINLEVLEREYQDHVEGLRKTLDGRFSYDSLRSALEAMEQRIVEIDELREKLYLFPKAASRQERQVLLRANKVINRVLRQSFWRGWGRRDVDPPIIPKLRTRMPSKFRLRNILLGLLLFFVVSCTIAGIASGPLGGPNCDNDGIEDSNFWDACPEPETP